MKLIVVINEKKEKTFIFPEPLTEDRQIFNKYVFSFNEKLSIGRSTDNDIAFNSKVVSSHHCEILYSNNR